MARLFNKIIVSMIIVQLYMSTLCGAKGTSARLFFEEESDASGSEFLNGFVEQEPPDATETYPYPTRDSSREEVIDGDNKIELTETDEEEVAIDDKEGGGFRESSDLTTTAVPVPTQTLTDKESEVYETREAKLVTGDVKEEEEDQESRGSTATTVPVPTRSTLTDTESEVNETGATIIEEGKLTTGDVKEEEGEQKSPDPTATLSSSTQSSTTDKESEVNETGTTQIEQKEDATVDIKEREGEDQVTDCNVGPRSDLFRGFPGRDGMPGRDGNPGVHGIPGIPGSKGERGSCDCKEEWEKFARESKNLYTRNIHQCAWNKINWSLELGKVQTCTFYKKHQETSLKVEWYGSLRILCSRGTPCCNRWYMTFNGAECTSPVAIDGLIFTLDHNATINIHRSSTISGICSGLPKGVMDVALWTGMCDGIYPSGPSRTGWNSASRIIIEEVELN